MAKNYIRAQNLHLRWNLSEDRIDCAPFSSSCGKQETVVRGLPDMNSTSEGKGGHGKADVVREVA